MTDKRNEERTEETTTAPQEKEPYVEPLLTKHDALRNPLGLPVKSGEKTDDERGVKIFGQ